MNDFNMDDILSEEEAKPPVTNTKKFAIIGGASLVVIVILITIIILVSTSKEEIKRDVIGEIKCTYEINNNNSPTQILGLDFKYERNFDIMIDSKKIKFTKEYKFSEIKNYKISFLIYDSLNMDNMFKDVSSLISVVMSSEKNSKILSFKSAFENTKNLEDFTITSFNTEETKSMSKMV